jgi:hypothetical protein
LRLEDKKNKEKKPKEFIGKRLKNCERNIQEPCHYIARPNL